jgi:hypothetical protein
MAFDLTVLIIHIIVNIIILAPVLWLSGRLLVGKDKAKLTDAIWIVVLGTVVGAIFGYFFSGWVALIIELVLLLLLVKHFFDCGWLKALAISIITVIILAVIVAILAIIGIALFFLI